MDEIDGAIVKDHSEVKKFLLLGVPLVYRENNLWSSIDSKQMDHLNDLPKKERELIRLMAPLPRDALFDQYYKKALLAAIGYVYESGLTHENIDVEQVVS